MKPIIAIVEWYGPFTLEDAQDASCDFGDGIYCALGMAKYERQARIQYIGLAKNLRARIKGAHHVLPQIAREKELWLGEVVSPRTPGRKIRTTDRMLDLVEWTHAYFLQLPLNKRKKAKPPKWPITVYNRWWRTDYETPYRKRPHNEWPDIIDFLGNEYPAKLVWFGGGQVVQDVAEFKY